MRKIHEDTFKKIDFNGAKGLICIKDRILVYRRDNRTKNFPGCLDLIGGGRENDESPFETFKREVKEEVGLDVTGNDIEFTCTYPSHTDPGKISFFFVTKPLNFTESQIKIGNEGLEWLLLSPLEYINRKDAIERQQKRVKDYLNEKL